MWSYVFISAGVATTTALLMYLDSRLTDRPKQKMTYLKVIIMTMVIVLAAIMLLTWLSPTENIKDVVQVRTPVSKITEEGWLKFLVLVKKCSLDHQLFKKNFLSMFGKLATLATLTLKKVSSQKTFFSM